MKFRVSFLILGLAISGLSLFSIFWPETVQALRTSRCLLMRSYCFPPPNLTLTATPSVILRGESSTLSWVSRYATSCTAAGGWTGTKPVNGKENVQPTVTTIYQLTCQGPGGSVTKSVTIIVKDVNLVVQNIGVSPSSIRVGDSVTVSGLIANIGAVGQAGFSDTRLRIDLGGDGTWDLTPGLRLIPPLEPGQSDTVRWLDIWTAIEGNHKLEICADATNRVAEINETDNCLVQMIVVTPPLPPSLINGDIFAGGKVSGLTIDPQSIIAAGSLIDVTGYSLFLEKYRPTQNRDWTQMSDRIIEIVRRLQEERARSWSMPTTISGIFNLNPPPTDTPTSGNIVGDFLNPEGSVWVTYGDLTLDTTKFYNRGTIVVIGGNVTITGDLSYGRNTGRTDSLGVIVLSENGRGGSITIEGGVKSVVGAYFATGSISLASSNSALTMQGSLAANVITIDRLSVQIAYDPRLEVVPPPGFAEILKVELEEAY